MSNTTTVTKNSTTPKTNSNSNNLYNILEINSSINPTIIYKPSSYLTVKQRIKDKLKKNNLKVSNKEINSLIDENLKSSNFINNNDDTIIQIINVLVKRNQPQNGSSCNIHFSTDQINQEYNKMIDDIKKSNINNTLSEKEIVKKIYKNKNNPTLNCIEQEIINHKIIPLIDKYNREDVVNWKNYTYNNPQNSLDTQFNNLQVINWNKHEEEHSLSSLNNNMVRLSDNKHVNYYDEIKNDNCKRNKACWFNDMITNDNFNKNY
jgi:hypothetical protein